MMTCRFFFFLLLQSVFLQANLPEPYATVHIPMRDGVELTADLYYPSATKEISNTYPCILLRVPAGRKADSWRHLAVLAEHGYVVAIQDTRSALDAEGKTVPYLSDGWGVQQDGFDTINWLASSSFTNGTIGTVGFSAAGITQIMLAPTAPPALKCQYIGQAAASLYHHAIFPGGRLQKNQVESWLGLYAPHPSVIDFVSGQPVYNDFWKTVDALTMTHKVEVPALHYGGWYDPFLQGTIDAYAALQESGAEGAKANQKLLMGPWNHFWPKDLSLGEFEVPANGRHAPIDVSPKRWFDHYLKDIDNGLPQLPNVTYYVMGTFDGSPTTGNVWRHSDTWPVPAVETPFYLSPDKTLSTATPKDKVAFNYVNDPANPVPTIGGRNLFLPSGPRDQRSIESREDVHVFTTKPLEEDLEVTGRIAAKLYISPDLADSDLALRLTDVYPDGKSLLVADGLVHIGKQLKEAPKAESTQPIEVDVDMWSTSVVFSKGHAIRISVAGSNYPRHEINRVKIGLERSQPEKAKIYVGGSTPSRLILPIVRKGDTWQVQPQTLDDSGQDTAGL